MMKYDQDAALKSLRLAWQTKHDEADAILKRGGDAISDDDRVKAAALLDERDETGRQIDARIKALKDAAALEGRVVEGKAWSAEVAGAPAFLFGAGAGGGASNARVEVVSTEADKLSRTGGFKSLGHFAWATIKQGRHGNGEPSAVASLKRWSDAQIELRTKHGFGLEEKSALGSYEDSDPDGGNLVPPGFSTQIYERMTASNEILSYLNTIPVSGNTMSIPALHESSRANGARNGGALGYWEGEADQYQSSKVKTRNVNLKLRKLTALTYVTEELLADSATALESYLGRIVPREINFKINDAVINGTGAGMPMGLLNAPSKITASAVASQGASTIVYKNILAMYKRIVAGQRGTMIWLYNQEAEDQLFSLYAPTGSTGTLIFKPNEASGGFTLMGRPALVVEQCAALGTEGDVIAFAPEGYACITKGGIQSFMSMHLRFDFDEFAYKWRFRMDGQPYDEAPLTPYKGSSTVSSIVTLSGSRS